MTKTCDNLSVGVIIEQDTKLALLRRARFPIAIAPAAGHVDQHGSPQQAAIDEVNEELGFVVAPDALIATAIADRRVGNPCRREGGNHHNWWVYRVIEFSGVLEPSASETRGAGWYDLMAVQALADRTRARQQGKVSPEEWDANPGLEEVWLDFMVELGYVR